MSELLSLLGILAVVAALMAFDMRRRRRARAANEAGRCGTCGLPLASGSGEWLGGYLGAPLWRACRACVKREHRVQAALGLLLLLAAVAIFALPFVLSPA